MADTESYDALIAEARAVRRRAYAPYSNFTVGAALRTPDGRVFNGCNVENSSLGLTNCAERTAVFAAVAAGCQEFDALVISSQGAVSPCGACRQVLAEFCEELTILLDDEDSERPPEVVQLSELLPRHFRLK